METLAVVVEGPGQVALKRLAIAAPKPGDLVVAVAWSGVSTGTEKLMFDGRMPPFPGMGYPLVPGYEAVGRVVDAGADGQDRIGELVFVPGSSAFVDARGLFGGSARLLVTASDRVVALPEAMGEQGVLMALAATARHAVAGHALPDLIIGHGVLGRLLARMAVAAGRRPTVWEISPARRNGAEGYQVIAPEEDTRRDYRAIYDVSGDSGILNQAFARLGHGGEVVLAGFYAKPLSFDFAPAFMKEARMRIAAEFQPDDLAAVIAMAGSGRLNLAGLISHRAPAHAVTEAYPAAFDNPDCLKMVLDWREIQ
jgi:3-hydroxyethyl bacteriochlorophyllide a dehydrogenase